jgi:hypothetical protein
VPTDVEIGNVDLLADKYPVVAADLRAIAASAQTFKASRRGGMPALQLSTPISYVRVV